MKPSTGPARSRNVTYFATALAAVLVAMLVAQLYTYEDLASSLSVILATNDHALVKIIAAGIVVAELLALPYLLGMLLSPLMRILSAVMAVGAILFWLIVTFTSAHAENVPLLGDVVSVPGGLIPFVWVVLMLISISVVIRSDTTVRQGL